MVAFTRGAGSGRARAVRHLVVVIIGALALCGWSATSVAAVGDCSPSATWGSLQPSLESQVLQLVNDHRTALGLGTLTLSGSLTASAEWKSLHMGFYNYLAHDDPAPPVSRTVGDRLVACGYPSNASGWGENIAYGYPDAASVMAGWLASPGHKANIENPSWTTIGIGVARNSSGTLYWTQDFGTTGASAPPPAPSSDTQPPSVPSGLAATAALSALKGARGGKSFDMLAPLVQTLHPSATGHFIDLAGSVVCGLMVGMGVSAYLAARRGVVAARPKAQARVGL